MPEAHAADTRREAVCHTMDEEHCAIAVPKRSCEVRQAADKRCYNVFSILCLCRPPTCPRGLREGTTVQNYEKVSIWEKKYAGAEKRARSQCRRHCDLAGGIGCGLANLVEAQVGHQALGHEDAVGGLVVLEDGGHDARQGEGRAVEGVAELGLAGLVLET